MKRIMMFLITALILAGCGEPSEIKSSPTPVSSAVGESEPVQREVVELIEVEDGGFGAITIPHIIGLESASVDQANALFESIRDNLLANNKEFLDTIGEPESNPSPLCVSEYSIHGDVLSILVTYHYYFGAPLTFFESVLINTSTGEAIDPHEVIAYAGYSMVEVENALCTYAYRCLMEEWEQDISYGYAYLGNKIFGVGDPVDGWNEKFEEMLEKFDAAQVSEGNAWDALPRSPMVYLNEEGQLYVYGEIPTLYNGEFRNQMVCVGHDEIETRRLNPMDPNGMLFGKGLMSEEACCAAVQHVLGLLNSQEDKLDADRMEIIVDEEGNYAPAYIIQIAMGENEYAVNPLTGKVYVEDGGAWLLTMEDTYSLTDILLEDAREDALAVVYNFPDEYELWSAQPVADLDLSEYGSETALLTVTQDGTTVTFESGMMNGDSFEAQSQMYSVKLNRGESVVVRMLRPEGMPSMAITVSVKEQSGTYVLVYDGLNGLSKTEYVMSHD